MRHKYILATLLVVLLLTATDIMAQNQGPVFRQISPYDSAGVPRAGENLDRLTPPELSFHIITANLARMYSGQLIEYRIKIFPFVWVKWLTEIKHVVEGQCFVDK